MWGKDTGDLAGICEEDEIAIVLCEGCGYIQVDKDGKRLRYISDLPIDEFKDILSE